MTATVDPTIPIIYICPQEHLLKLTTLAFQISIFQRHTHTQCYIWARDYDLPSVQFRTDPGELPTAPLVTLPTLPLLEDGKAAQMQKSQSSLQTRALSFMEKKMLLYLHIIPLLFHAKT